MTYNILLGARYRESLVTGVVTRCAPDVVALQEVTDIDYAQSLAQQLDMKMLVGPPSDPGSDLATAILTRLPVRRWRNHRHPGEMLRGHLEAEIVVGAAPFGDAIRVHCLHLAARVGERPSEHGALRHTRREVDAVLDDIRALPDRAHIVVGDFNAIAPGEVFAASTLLHRLGTLRRAGLLNERAVGQCAPTVRRGEVDAAVDRRWEAAGIPRHLDVSVPAIPRWAGPLLRCLPEGRNVDRLLSRLVEHQTIRTMLARGYVDAYRSLHPGGAGYTCATWAPASRIDYVFASADVAPRIARCDVVGGPRWPDSDVSDASDHRPVVTDITW